MQNLLGLRGIQLKFFCPPLTPFPIPKQATEEISKNVTAMKQILQGDGEHEPNPDNVAQLANEIYASGLIPLIITNLPRFEFEVTQHVMLSPD